MKLGEIAKLPLLRISSSLDGFATELETFFAVVEGTNTGLRHGFWRFVRFLRCAQTRNPMPVELAGGNVVRELVVPAGEARITSQAERNLPKTSTYQG